ncbi:transketolase OS=Streptomyces tendae OX=1932 GN=GUR47_02150 PE=3 SV=1 [Streptomyces tendae]
MAWVTKGSGIWLLPLRRQPHLDQGDTATAFLGGRTERYEADGLHTQRVEPAENGDIDVQALHAALTAAKAETGDRPSSPCRRSSPRPAAGTPRALRRSTARPRRGRGRRHQARPRLRTPAVLRGRRRGPRRHPPGPGPLRRGADAAWDKSGIAAWRTPPSARRSSYRVVAGLLPDGWEDALPVFETGKAVATLGRLRQGSPGAWPGPGRAVGLVGRPGRLQQDHHRQHQLSFLPEGNPLPWGPTP